MFLNTIGKSSDIRDPAPEDPRVVGLEYLANLYAIGPFQYAEDPRPKCESESGIIVLQERKC